MNNAPLYEIANTSVLYKDPNATQDAPKEEVKQPAQNNRMLVGKPPMSLKILAIYKYTLIIQLYNGDLKCLDLKHPYLNFALMLKGNEEDRRHAVYILQSRKDQQQDLYPLITWAGLQSLVNYEEVGIPTEVNQHNYVQLLKSRPALDIIHAIVTNTQLDKLDKINILEDLFEKFRRNLDYNGALMAAMSLGNREYVATALRGLSRHAAADAIERQVQSSEEHTTALDDF